MKLILFNIVLLLSQSLWAQSSRLNSEEDYKETWSITFGGSYTSTVLQHAETSSNSSYSTSGRRIRVPDVKYGLSLMRELFNSNTISVTVIGFGGVTDSDTKSGGRNDQPQFTENLNGFHFGGGLSLNYNTYAYGLKVQPYVGVAIMQEQLEYDLEHSSGVAALNTFHEVSATVAHPGLGVRCFDADVNLMSYFQITTTAVMSETITASGRVGQSDVAINSNTSFEREPWAFSLGFGYYF